MRFYTKQHSFYCGVDLHARTMYLCVLDSASKVRLHRNVRTRPALFLRANRAWIETQTRRSVEAYREARVDE